jgi:hypothetical protein
MYLYRHIRLDTNKPFYIGIGSDTKGKYTRAHQKTNRNTDWYSIVKQTPYKVEIMLDNLPSNQLYESEKFFINYYGKIQDGGLLVNKSSGGKFGKLGTKDSAETRFKKSLAAQQPKTECWKQSQSMSRKGKSRGKLPWLENNKERSTKISKALLGNTNRKKKPILQLDRDNNIINEYNSITEAFSLTKIKGIGNVLTNRAKTAGGYIWKYNNKK